MTKLSEHFSFSFLRQKLWKKLYFAESFLSLNLFACAKNFVTRCFHYFCCIFIYFGKVCLFIIQMLKNEKAKANMHCIVSIVFSFSSKINGLWHSKVIFIFDSFGFLCKKCTFHVADAIVATLAFAWTCTKMHICIWLIKLNEKLHIDSLSILANNQFVQLHNDVLLTCLAFCLSFYLVNFLQLAMHKKCVQFESFNCQIVQVFNVKNKAETMFISFCNCAKVQNATNCIIVKMLASINWLIIWISILLWYIQSK